MSRVLARSLAGAALIVSTVALLGCPSRTGRQAPAASRDEAGIPSDSGSSSEAERTHQIEEQAAELQRRGEEIQQMEGTPEEKERAMNELLLQQQELQRQAESGS